MTSVELAILLFDRVTALDAVGPYEVLQRVPGMTVRFVASEPGVKTTEDGSLKMTADTALDDAPSPDVVLVPGGVGEVAVRDDERALAWLRATHATSRYTTSVCTGSLVLAAAGILDGVRATTHWLAMDTLAALGAVAVQERVVESGKISLPRACRRASTWHCCSWRASRVRTSPTRSNCRSSTTRNRRSTSVPPPRPPITSSPPSAPAAASPDPTANLRR